MAGQIDLTKIRLAREELQGRQAGLIQTIRDRSPQRFTAENANQDATWEGSWLGQDQERSKQLDWLEKYLKSDNTPDKLIGDEADTREKSNILNAETAHRRISGQSAVLAARTGQAGSSVDADRRATMDMDLSMAKVKARQYTDELKNAGIRGADAMQEELIGLIMQDSDSYALAQQAAITGQRVEIQGAKMQSDLERGYRDILSNTIGNVINNVAAPAISTGFDYADRANRTTQDNWERWNSGDRTAPPPKISDNTWWGW
jgi:hypothetical protein